jgi:hypothetical protein
MLVIRSDVRLLTLLSFFASTATKPEMERTLLGAHTETVVAMTSSWKDSDADFDDLTTNTTHPEAVFLSPRFGLVAVRMLVLVD